jgi:hypothetical protein
MMRLSVDFEYTSRTWWDNGGQDLWDAVTEGFDGSSVVLDDHLASSWLAEASRIPGWSDGTEYAPHPIVARPVEDDEPDV